MENPTDTAVDMPDRRVIEASRNACIVRIYPTGAGMGTRYPLGVEPMALGRGNDCDILINDGSVSRRHASIELGAEGYQVIDFQSTNGTFINDVPASARLLKDGDNLRIGNCIFRFLTGGNVEANYHEEIYRLTIIDALTGIHNKRYLLEFLERELARSTRYHRPLALILFDLDRFKSINDEIGHLGGDYALREIAGIAKNNTRKEELFARYGGEEFVVVLPETLSAGALTVAERLRSRVEKHEFQYEGKRFPVTISVGVAMIDGDETLTPNDLIQQADEKLYQAKELGRNRVVM